MTPSTRFALVVVALALFVTVARAERLASSTDTSCSVAIVSPEAGEMVGRQRVVSGTATIPPGGHLWVFAHIKGLYGWWPQGGGEAEVVDGTWDVMTFFGQAHDIGAQFDIAAAIVNDSINQDLEAYVERSARAGDWPPIRLPNVFQGCPVSRVTTTKTSH
jgi:hypothetical protein